MSEKLRSMVDFLMGNRELEGVSFGERHPTKAGAFWWRLNLRAAVNEDHPSKKEAQEAFEAWFGGDQCVGHSERMQMAWLAAVEWMGQR